MRVKLVQATTVEIDPTKKYLVLIQDTGVWTQDDRQKLVTQIQGYMPNVVVLFPLGAKFKIVEAPNE